ncbi:hypothetical protein [Achromobacter xylosoxidans]|uniref:Uncharacterized protein n=1 Tax=Achromobacter xylosoxidans (strain A8) TaxID=762376 RepID=E3HGP4_ACHXA|nr:hypothetical protein [Achromobacter xylosoxidans]ADP15380.1 hypothetical protein AXYL_02051 [Achromobacter xylosoxidans A8]
MANIDALRDHLFATLAALRDPTQPMDIDRAKAVSEVAQTIINSAKVEVDFMRQTGQTAPPRFLLPEGQAPAETTATATGLKEVSAGVTRHRLGG